MQINGCFKEKIASFLIPELTVDNWNLTHEPNGNMSEEYIGKVAIDNEESILYLGDVLSNNGSNMKNIFTKETNPLELSSSYQN